jgi:hypothetical protein
MSSKGVGDTVEKILRSAGVKKIVGENCSPCDKRKEKLNQMFPYKQKS